MKLRNRLHRADIENLPEYVVNPMPDLTRVIKLDANENPYGPSPRTLAALREVQTWHYYHEQEDLRLAIAAYVDVPFEEVVVTNGADESIDLVFRTVLEPGEVVIDCPPSFEMYRITAHAHRGRVIEVERREDFSLDLPQVVETCERTRAKIIMLCSPNNPDGGMLPRADLERLLALPTLVVLDEAYAEFSGESAAHLLGEHDNLVILRTFSKWAGLAGLRVGYALLPPLLAAAVLRIKSPYNVNAAGLVAALASLEDREILMERVRTMVQERERVYAELRKLGRLEPIPGRGNFILCRVIGMEGQSLKHALKEKGILIRAYHSHRLADYVRISIGTPEQNEAVLAALRATLSEKGIEVK